MKDFIRRNEGRIFSLISSLIIICVIAYIATQLRKPVIPVGPRDTIGIITSIAKEGDSWRITATEQECDRVTYSWKVSEKDSKLWNLGDQTTIRTNLAPCFYK